MARKKNRSLIARSLVVSPYRACHTWGGQPEEDLARCPARRGQRIPTVAALSTPGAWLSLWQPRLAVRKLSTTYATQDVSVAYLKRCLLLAFVPLP
eukprot:scaffold324711_cov67-Tisochrysis_lutea.AAC.2